MGREGVDLILCVSSCMWGLAAHNSGLGVCGYSLHIFFHDRGLLPMILNFGSRFIAEVVLPGSGFTIGFCRRELIDCIRFRK